VASSQGKKTGRVTAKGTKPPAKPGRTAATGAGRKGSAGDAAAAPSTPLNSPNRQMRRSGNVPEPVEAGQEGRLKLVLIAGGAITAVLVLLCLVLFHLSGTWIGLIGIAAGLATSVAVSTGKTWAADKGRVIAIGIAAVGVLATILGVSGVVNFHWPLAALIGCGLGAAVAELSAQQMTPPQGPPQSAIALLRRTGAQQIPAPSTGDCVWATPDGRIRVIVGATIPEDASGDDLLRDKHVRRSLQRGSLVTRRLAAIGVESGIICVVSSATVTVRDGDDTICSAAGLTKALAR